MTQKVDRNWLPKKLDQLQNKQYLLRVELDI